MSSSVGPSRVSRPRKSSAATSNGSTASSIGIADGARTGASGVILISGDWDVMALYLGSEVGNRKGVVKRKTIVVPANAGTHSHQHSLLRKVSDTSRNERSRGMGPGVRRDDDVDSYVPFTPPCRNTRPECPSAHAGGFRPRRIPPIAGRRSP